ncbi:hypothetical protein H4F45_04980 [Pectobacterium brasiliense]|uniref:Uncharacterized protein n=1 Tax=Pectobacterium brasiliense TaxID=180957 RepID=A0AAE3BDU9_9GAMM|nr:hypothetical protein [Pectobacterium brasiliense]MBN3050843.1 hypothetical protein [Pectobacterium brasiliense]
MVQPIGWVLYRFRLDVDIIDFINKTYKSRGVEKSDLIDGMIDWFSMQRSSGDVSHRYFSSALNAPYTTIWLRPETAKKIVNLAELDKHNKNRVIYTAIIRYLEHDDQMMHL